MTRKGARARAAASPPDGGVLLAAGVLLLFGVLMIYSTTAARSLGHVIPPLLLQHLGRLSAGLALGAIAFWAPLLLWRRTALPLYALGLALLVATAIWGDTVNGARRWLTIPWIDFRFQPVELVKFATLIAVASVVAERDGHRELVRRQELLVAALTATPIGLLLLQPDLGSAVVLAALVVLVLVVAGTPLRRLALPGFAAIGTFAIYVASNAYALKRLLFFWDPWRDPLGAGFQLIQSLIAFNQGGIFGVGVGDGRQKLFYLPEAHNDFILAAIAEETGLVGVLVVLGAFAALLVAGARIAREAGDRFALLLAFGMTALVTLPALVNAAVVMGLLPTKGLTLPFLSFGGTSVVVSCTALGVLLGIARRRPHPTPVVRPSPMWRTG